MEKAYYVLFRAMTNCIDTLSEWQGILLSQQNASQELEALICSLVEAQQEAETFYIESDC